MEIGVVERNKRGNYSVWGRDDRRKVIMQLSFPVS